MSQRPENDHGARPWSRRQFFAYSAAVTAALAGSPAFARWQTKPGEARRVMHIIGHSHIDLAWLWPWRDGADVVLNTFRSALDRMNETPDFRYVHSSALHYRWVEHVDPKMFEEVRQRIAEGRWEVVGGWPVEPDCNLPSTESFVRHALYGKTYLKDKLGVDVTIGFNPDAFGHSAGLPTILANAGYKYYAFLRPQETEESLPLLFWWEGPDGQRLLAMRMYRSYSNATARLPDAVPNSFAPGFDHAAFFLGVGDHGGGVTKQQIRELIELQKDASLPELRWSTLGEFFKAVEASSAFTNLPVVKGELQHHARGCYSANGSVKYDNRRAERALGESEAISVMAAALLHRPYPADAFREAWGKVLTNQFHDILAGTTLAENYQDVRDAVGWACETASTEKIEALQTMARQVDTRRVHENSVFLFNPLPWKRLTCVDIYVKQIPKAEPQYTHLQPAEGAAIPIQLRPSRSMAASFPRLAAWVELPACGYRVLELAKNGTPSPTPYVDNCTIAPTGFGLSSLRASDGAELLSGTIGLVAIKDTSSTWGHKIDQFRDELGRPTFVSSELVESGPVVRTTRQRATWRASEIILEISQYAGVDAIELRFVIDWREREQILKLEIPTRFSPAAIFSKVPGAVIERKTNGEEEPCQDWVAVTGSLGGKPYTVGLVNHGSYSHDCLDGLLRMILVRSAPYARHSAATMPAEDVHDTNAWQDQGRQERTFWLVGGEGTHLSLNLDRRSEELQTPAEHVVDSAHAGDASWEQSFLDVSPSTFGVLAIKQAESGGGVILRIQERAGQASDCRIRSTLFQVDSTVRFRPFEMKTLRIGPTTAPGMREASQMELLPS